MNTKSTPTWGGFQTECELGAKASSAIHIILKNIERNKEDGASAVQFAPYHTCSTCNSLPDDITVNTGRDYHFPDAFSKLTWVSGDNYERYYRCPECHTFYEWINMPQMYGSGNNDEERLVRQSKEESEALEVSFSKEKK